MTKEQFIALGIDDATATKAATASAEELKSYVAKSQFDEISTAKKTLDGQIKDRDKQLETLKKSTGDAEALKAEIAKLQEGNKTAKTEYESKIRQMQIDHAVETALTGAKAKNTKAVRALLDLEKAELNGEQVKGLEDQIKKLREAEDSKFLFDAEEQAPKIYGMNPAESGDTTGQNLSTGAQFAAMYNSQFTAPTK